MRPISELVIHHSACLEGSVERFTREHRARGFGTIGYHAIIGNGHGTENGLLAEGRPESVVGCGVYGANTGKLHICVVGNFHRADAGYTGRPTPEQFDTLGGWLLSRGARYAVPYTKVRGHGEVAIPGHGTACPGDQFPLGLIRKWYEWALQCQKTGLAVTKLSVWLDSHDYPTHAHEQRAPSIVIFRGAEGHQFVGPVQFVNGKTFVSLTDLALSLGWPQPEWHPTTREVHVHTGTK